MVEADIVPYVNVIVQPVFAALESEAICRVMHGITTRTIATKSDAWSSLLYEAILTTIKSKVNVVQRCAKFFRFPIDWPIQSFTLCCF